MKETDIKAVKQMAKLFLYFEPQKTKFSPAIISHPFTDSGITMCKGEDGQAPELLNILEDDDAMVRWRQDKRAQIEAIREPSQMLALLTKPYYLTFLKYASPYLSQQDHSKYLASAWIMEEAPNGNRNFTVKQMAELFKQADPKAIMDAEEYAQFQQLPDTVTIYRGVTSFNAKRIKALSWTLSKDTAEWFANRFGEKGTVYQAQIKKEHILALFNGRNESEVIVDPKYLNGIAPARQQKQGLSMEM